MWCDVMWCDVMWCDVMWCDVMWCDVMWCDVMWCAFSTDWWQAAVSAAVIVDQDKAPAGMLQRCIKWERHAQLKISLVSCLSKSTKLLQKA